MRIVLRRTGYYDRPYTCGDYLVHRIFDRNGNSWWQIGKRGSKDRSVPLRTLSEVRDSLRRRHRESN